MNIVWVASLVSVGVVTTLAWASDLWHILRCNNPDDHGGVDADEFDLESRMHAAAVGSLSGPSAGNFSWADELAWKLVASFTARCIAFMTVALAGTLTANLPWVRQEREENVTTLMLTYHHTVVFCRTKWNSVKELRRSKFPVFEGSIQYNKAIVARKNSRYISCEDPWEELARILWEIVARILAMALVTISFFPKISKVLL
jgi:hypothetical protein